MSPTASRGKSGRAYRYYVSASLQQGAERRGPGHIQRLSAPEIERVVAEATKRWVPRTADPFAILRTAKLVDQGLRIKFDCAASAEVAGRLGEGEKIFDQSAGGITALLPIALPLRGGRRLVVPSASPAPRPDPVLIAALRKAHAMLTFERGLPVMATAPASPYDRTILRLGLLAPDIQQAILHGRQQHWLNLEALRKIDIPLAWSAQRERLGFAHIADPCSGP